MISHNETVSYSASAPIIGAFLGQQLMSKQHGDVVAVARTRCAHDEGAADCSYRVAWQINPHMRPGATDSRLAEKQHRALVTELSRAGASVLELPFVHGAFDSVFMKDSAILGVSSEGAPAALLCRFTEPVRQREQRDRAAALERLGFRVIRTVENPLEGGDVVRFADGSALLGHGFRSSAGAAAILGEFIGASVLPLQLVDPWLYHLDTALAVMSDGLVLACEEALSPSSIDALARHPAVRELRFVPREEALAFSLNIVQVGNKVITGSSARVTARLLERRGYVVRPLELSEFQLAGGSASCLVSRLHVDGDGSRGVAASAHRCAVA